ncbi:hypothetical protein MC885_018208, partial [Smutsia gigantea]
MRFHQHETHGGRCICTRLSLGITPGSPFAGSGREPAECDAGKEERAGVEAARVPGAVELQRKAVQAGQTLKTIRDTLHVAGAARSPLQTRQNSASGESVRDAAAPAGHRTHLTTHGDAMGVDHSTPDPPCARRGDAGGRQPGDSGARQASETEYVWGRSQATIPQGSLANAGLDRTAMKRKRKAKERRPEVSRHLNVPTSATAVTAAVTAADARETLSHRRQGDKRQLIHQLRFHPPPGRAAARGNADLPPLPSPGWRVLPSRECAVRPERQVRGRRPRSPLVGAQRPGCGARARSRRASGDPSTPEATTGTGLQTEAQLGGNVLAPPHLWTRILFTWHFGMPGTKSKTAVIVERAAQGCIRVTDPNTRLHNEDNEETACVHIVNGTSSQAVFSLSRYYDLYLTELAKEGGNNPEIIDVVMIGKEETALPYALIIY